MKLDMTVSDKIRIGFFIDFQRKNHATTYANKDFIIENFIYDICSKQTYNKIVKGQPLKESEIYDQLLQRLGYKFNYDGDKIVNIEDIEEKISKALKNKNLTAFYSLLRQLIQILLEFQTCPFQYTALQCFLILAKSEKTTKMPKKDVCFLINCYRVLNDTEKEICAYFIFRYMYDHDVSDKELNTMIQKINIRDLNEVYNKIFILNLMIRLQQYYDASVYCEKLLTSLQGKEEFYYMECLLTRLFLVSEIQPDSFEYYKKEYLELSNHNGNKTNMCNFYHIAGLYYYRHKDMEKAYQYFLKAINKSEYFFPEIILLNHIATLYHKELPENLKKERNVEKFDEEWQILYRFYCMKHQGENKKLLEDYLWKYGRKLVKKSYPSWMMKNIITTEFAAIAEETGNRKRLYQFNKTNI